MNKKPIQTSILIAEQAILLIIAVATVLASIIELVRIYEVMTVNLSDLFLLFIYAEVLGMVGVFYQDNRIPVTLPIIIAITALTRMIILQSKGLDALNIIYEASGILLLSVAAKTPLACFKEHTVSTNNKSTFGAILSTFSSYIFDACSTGGQISGLYDAIKGPIEPATRPVPNLSRALQAAATEEFHKLCISCSSLKCFKRSLRIV